MMGMLTQDNSKAILAPNHYPSGKESQNPIMMATHWTLMMMKRAMEAKQVTAL
jgi:hypothetical protein